MPVVAATRFLKLGQRSEQKRLGLLFLLGQWGPCADCDDCPADFDGDCTVGILDFLLLLGTWG